MKKAQYVGLHHHVNVFLTTDESEMNRLRGIAEATGVKVTFIAEFKDPMVEAARALGSLVHEPTYWHWVNEKGRLKRKFPLTGQSNPKGMEKE